MLDVHPSVYPFGFHSMGKEQTLQVNGCRDQALLCENEIDHLEPRSRRARWIHIHVAGYPSPSIIQGTQKLAQKSSTSLAIAWALLHGKVWLLFENCGICRGARGPHGSLSVSVQGSMSVPERKG